MKIQYQHIILVLLFTLVLSACNSTRYLKSGETLYDRTKINIIDDENTKNEKKLNYSLYNTTKPKPNRSVLGLFRMNLWIYNKTKDAEGGMGKWINENLGEAPVLLDSASVNNSAGALEKKLFKKGHFYADVDFETEIKNKRATVTYNVKLLKPHLIRKVYFPPDTSYAAGLIRKEIENSILNEGEQFDVGNLDLERSRLARVLNDRGFYDFNKNYIEFKLDTAMGEKKIDIYTHLKPPKGAINHTLYTINETYVFPNYSSEFTRSAIKDTVYYKDYQVVYTEDENFKPQLFDDFLLLRKEDVYSREKHDYTLSHLLSLDAFKFINIRYEKVDSNKLNTYVFLTPSKIWGIETNAELNNKSEDIFGKGFLGTAVSLNVKNRNLLKRAEQINFNVFGGVEFDQLTNDRKDLISTIDVTSELKLRFPKFISPIPMYISRYYRPTTETTLSYNFVRRIRYYDLASINFKFAYDWQESVSKKHSAAPITINYLRTFNQDPENFDELIEKNPFFAKSIEDQLIVGGSYTFTFSNQNVNPNKFLFFIGKLEIAGNSLSLVERIANGSSSEDTLKIFGLNYSQYARLFGDFRHYFQFPNSTLFASRIAAGFGLPYGNSSVLPYVKQFYVGGPSSVRAFSPRTLGPGTREPVEGSDLDNTGEIKIEANLEYRFSVWEYFYLKGAVFLDAGNVWLFDKSGTQESGQFKFDSFMNEMALGTGFGLRLDVSYFVLRTDLAFPLRVPYRTAGDRWVHNKIDFFNSDWRSENLTLSIAIGYPF